MPHDGANWRVTARRVALTLSATALFGITAVQAQNFVRGPNINIGPRAAVINPNMGPPVGALAVGRVAPDVRTPSLSARMAVRPQYPYLRTTPNLYPSCGGPARDSNGECIDVLANSGGNGGSGKGKTKGGPRRNATQAGLLAPTIPNEIVAEIDSALSDEQADALARRHGMRRIVSQNFPLIGATIGLFRISDGRSFETVRRGNSQPMAACARRSRISAFSSNNRRRRRPRATRHNMRWPNCGCRRRTSSPMGPASGSP